MQSSVICCFIAGDSTAETAEEKDREILLLVFGGMDTQGEIFNDFIVLRPEIVNKN